MTNEQSLCQAHQLQPRWKTWLSILSALKNISRTWKRSLPKSRSPKGITLENLHKFDFNAFNNQAKYEAFLTRLNLAREVGERRIRCHIDS
ncbi:hypothetical protein CR513_44855, partial [Mucuna pruriens]